MENKVLIIGDIHGRNFWREAISKNASKVNKIIFLGDYLDPYPEEIEKNRDLMECAFFNDSENLINMLQDIISLKKINPDKYVLLTGNHTSSYIWSNFNAASRTDYKNWEKYHNFFLENLNLFNLVWIENSVILSHAGISQGWAKNFLYSYMKYDEEVELEKNSVVFETARVLKDTSLKDFNKYYIDSISNISYYRGGDSLYGSCEWADLREHIDHHQSEVKEKLVPLGDDEIYQVFGHTQLQKPLLTEKWACLDCRKAFIIDISTYEINEC